MVGRNIERVEEMARSGLLRFAIGALGAIGLAIVALFALSPAGQASAQTPTSGTMRTICFNGQTLRVQELQLAQYTGYTSGPCQNNCDNAQATNFGQRGECEFEKCRDRDAINFDERGKCEFDDEDEDDEDDENDENDEVIVIVRQAPPIIVPQPVIVERQVIVEQQPVVVQQPVIVQRTVVQEAQGGGTTSVVAPATTSTITAPAAGDGGLADPHHNAASTASASVAQALGIILGSFGVVALYSYFARRARD